MEGGSWWLAVWFPVKEGVNLPLSDVCQLLVSLVNCTIVLGQSARSPGPAYLNCPYGKQKVNKTEVKVDSIFLDSPLTGMVLWFSAFKKVLVPICLLTSITGSLDSFSAY